MVMGFAALYSSYGFISCNRSATHHPSSQFGELLRNRTRLLEVKVVGREAGNIDKRLPAEDLDVFSFPLDEAARAQVLDHPVGVDRGHAGGVGHVGLCPWDRKRSIPQQADRAK